MGLDVSVYRPVPVNPLAISLESTVSLEDCPELKTFSALAFPKEEEFYDLEKAAAAEGLSLEDFEIILVDDGLFKIRVTKDGSTLELTPGIVVMTVMHIAVNEVGYQRRGANQKFYDEGIADSPCILDRKTLIEHWEKYFDSSKEFKHNIIDKFVEGEMFVVYS